MKLPCVLIHDLLPLYAEHLTSPETDQLLAEHLQSCPACQEELHALKLPVPVQSASTALLVRISWYLLSVISKRMFPFRLSPNRTRECRRSMILVMPFTA